MKLIRKAKQGYKKICVINLFFLITFIIILIAFLIPFISASDVLVWQGQYYTGTTFNTGTYEFNFTVYDALVGGGRVIQIQPL
jgi:hypothetical protein